MARLRRLNPAAPLWRAAEDALDAEALICARSLRSGEQERGGAPLVRRGGERGACTRIITSIAAGTATASIPSRLSSTGRSTGPCSASG